MTNIRPNFSDLEANRLHVKSSEFIGSKAEKENLVRTRRYFLSFIFFFLFFLQARNFPSGCDPQ